MQPQQAQGAVPPPSLPQQQQQQQQGPPPPVKSPTSAYPWSRLKLTLPIFPRCDHASATYNYQLKNSLAAGVFLFGGKMPAQSAAERSGSFFLIDAATLDCRSVRSSGDIPSVRSGHSMAVVNGHIYLFGGLDNDAKPDEALYVYSIGRNQWRKPVLIGNLPVGRTRHTASVVGTRMYIFGGLTENYYLNDMVILDTANLSQNLQWGYLTATNSNLPRRRAGHSAVVFEDRILVFGGNDEEHCFNDLWYYNPADNTWQLIKGTGYVPTPRTGHAACMVGDIMYVFGGRTSNGQDLNDLYAFRFLGNRWYTFQKMGPAPSPRHGCTLVTYGSRVYVLGGSDTEAHPSVVSCLETAKIRYPPQRAGSSDSTANTTSAAAPPAPRPPKPPDSPGPDLQQGGVRRESSADTMRTPLVNQEASNLAGVGFVPPPPPKMPPPSQVMTSGGLSTSSAAGMQVSDRQKAMMEGGPQPPQQPFLGRKTLSHMGVEARSRTDSLLFPKGSPPPAGAPPNPQQVGQVQMQQQSQASTPQTTQFSTIQQHSVVLQQVLWSSITGSPSPQPPGPVPPSAQAHPDQRPQNQESNIPQTHGQKAPVPFQAAQGPAGRLPPNSPRKDAEAKLPAISQVSAKYLASPFPREPSVSPEIAPSAKELPLQPAKELPVQPPKDADLLRAELTARETEVAALKNKLNWLSAELHVGGRAMDSKFEEKALGAGLLQDVAKADKDSEQGRFLGELLKLRRELRQAKISISHTERRLASSLAESEQMRLAALCEAAYHKSRFAALAEERRDVLESVDSRRADELERHLAGVLNKCEAQLQEIDSLRSNLERQTLATQLTKEARRADEERAREAESLKHDLAERLAKTEGRLQDVEAANVQIQAKYAMLREKPNVADLSEQVVALETELAQHQKAVLTAGEALVAATARADSSEKKILQLVKDAEHLNVRIGKLEVTNEVLTNRAEEAEAALEKARAESAGVMGEALAAMKQARSSNLAARAALRDTEKGETVAELEAQVALGREQCVAAEKARAEEFVLRRSAEERAKQLDAMYDRARDEIQTLRDDLSSCALDADAAKQQARQTSRQLDEAMKELDMAKIRIMSLTGQGGERQATAGREDDWQARLQAADKRTAEAREECRELEALHAESHEEIRILSERNKHFEQQVQILEQELASFKRSLPGASHEQQARGHTEDPTEKANAQAKMALLESEAAKAVKLARDAGFTISSMRERINELTAAASSSRENARKSSVELDEIRRKGGARDAVQESRVRELEEHVQSLASSLRQKEEMLKQKEADLLDVRRRIENLESRLIDEQRSRQQEAESHSKALKQKVAELELALVELRTAQQYASQRAGESQQAVGDMAARIAELAQRSADLEEDLSVAVRERDGAIEQCQELFRAVEEATAHAAQLEEAAKEHETRRAELEKSLADSERFAGDSLMLQAELAHLREEVGAACRAKETAIEESADREGKLKMQLETFQAESVKREQELKKELDMARDESEKREEELAALLETAQAENASLEESLKGELNAARADEAKLREEHAAALDVAFRLDKELAEKEALRKELDDSRAVVQNLRDQAAAATDKANGLTEEVDRLSERAKSLQADLDKLTEQEIASRAEVEKLTEEAKVAQVAARELEAAKKELESLQETIARLEAEMKEKEKGQDERVKLEEELQQLEEEHQEALSVVDQLSQELKNAVAQKDRGIKAMEQVGEALKRAEAAEEEAKVLKTRMELDAETVAELRAALADNKYQLEMAEKERDAARSQVEELSGAAQEAAHGREALKSKLAQLQTRLIEVRQKEETIGAKTDAQ